MSSQIAPMPQLAGDGWGAPGRAVQQLGQSIASLGGAFDAMAEESNKEQDFKDKMEMLKFSNETDLDEINTQQNYTGDGTDYETSRSSVYQERADALIARISPRNQQRAALFVETKRGPVLEGATRFGGQRRQGAMMGTIEEAIGSEYGKLTEADPETFDQQFTTASRGIDAIIDNAPLPDSAKEALRAKAADLAQATLLGVGKSDPKAALEALPRAERFIEMYGGKIDGRDATQSGAEGVPGLPGSPSGPAQEKPPIGKQSSLTDGQAVPQEGSAFEIAKSFVGANERADASTLSKFFEKTSGQKLNPRDTAWCAAFVNATLAANGQDGTGTLLARDFLKFGEATKSPSKGDIVVLTRGNSSWQGHVGFYAGKDSKGNVLVLGGNQGNAVSVKPFAASSVLGYRVPPKSGGEIPGVDVASVAQPVANPAAQPGAAGIKPTLTAYSPQKAGDKMEGGYAAARPGPDGKAEVRTLADFQAGRSQYVTLAGDRSEFGKSYIIPEITYRDASGKTITLQNVNGVVHDTGSAFKGKGNQRFDIPVDKDIPSKSLGSQPFSKQQLAFIPEGEAGKPQQLAGLSKLGMGDVEPPAGARSSNTIPGPSNDNTQGEIKVADASGRTVPQGVIPQVAGSEQRLPTPGKTSVGSHLRDKLIKALPAYRKQYEGLVGNMVGAVEKAAAEGYLLPDELMAETEAAVAKVGTPEMTLRLAKAKEGANFTRTLQALPPNEVARVAGDMRAKMLEDGATPEMLARVEATEKLHTTINAELEKNAITWGVRVGVIPEVEPITLENLSPEVLEQRAVAANTVAQHYKRDPQFFTSDERTMMEGVFKQGGDKMLGMMAMVYQSFGDQTPAVVAEIAPKNPEVVRAAYLLATGGDHQAARDIAATMERRADPNYKPDVKLGDSETMESTMREVVGDFYKRFPRGERDATMRAAEAIYAARVDNPGVWEPDTFKQSVEAALGTRVNGAGKKFGGVINSKEGGYIFGSAGDPILLPSNVRQDTFREMLDSVTMADLQEAGHPLPLDATGKPISVTKAMNGRLVTVDRGKYAVSLGDPDVAGNQKWVAMQTPVPDGLAVENVPMQRFTLDLEKLIPVLRKRHPEMFFSDN